MKILLLLLMMMPAVFAQGVAISTSDVYQMGDRRVRVPAPDGFTEISSQFDTITGRMRATEDPANDLLALHVPESFVAKLRISEEIDLEFYTKVSVNRQTRAMDISPELNASVVADLEKNFGAYLDPNGAVMKGVERNSAKGLTKFLGDETSVSINSTKYLGFIQKTDKVFSGVLLISFEVYGRKLTTLATVSLLHLNRRLVFLNVYKLAPKTSDVASLSDFTKKWTAKIVDANK